jgi:antitoxin component of MazEF toxin-antitoxin module
LSEARSILATFEVPLRVKKSKAGGSAFVTIPYYLVDAYMLHEGDILGLEITKVVKPEVRKK